MMGSKRLRRRHGLLLALVGAALFGIAAVAYAAIPDSNGSLYHACMLNGVGTIRLIDPSLDSARAMNHCTRMETEITWGQVGPEGRHGPEG